jgi:hypothetical protein
MAAGNQRGGNFCRVEAAQTNPMASRLFKKIAAFFCIRI